MKLHSYEWVINKNVIDVKRYLLKVCNNQDIDDIVNCSMDVAILKRNINRDKKIQLYVYLTIKKCIDQSQDLQEMEEHLVYLNLLLASTYQPLLDYKYNLFNYLIERAGFTIEIYCLLRHLIKFKLKIIEPFVVAIAKRLNISITRYHYLATQILLLEKNYRQVYYHLPYISIDTTIRPYLLALYNFSPRLYRRYFKNKQDNYELIIA